jgi:hypothetical protein
VTRLCSRPACSEPACATLTYVHATSTAWIDALTPHREPHGYDLCDRHADGASVPRGWQLVDRRPSHLAFAERLAG